MLVIHKPARLSGAEVRYLRKSLGWSGEDFAKHMGVDPSTVSKWENEKEPIGTSSDRLLRLMIARETPVEEYSLDELTKIENRAEPPLKLRVRQQNQRWALAEASP
jgi:DNA-binding transcriptional regulator YiaG